METNVEVKKAKAPLTLNNKIMSPQMRVKPLALGQTAVYKLVDTDREDLSKIIEGTNKHPTCNPGYHLRGEKRIFDPFSGKNIVIRNIVGEKALKDDKTGEIKYIPDTEMIHFRRGTVIVTSDMPETYVFMERCNENRSNPYRKKGSPDVFYRVDREARAQERLVEDEMLADAMLWIKSADHDELRAICANLPKNEKVSPDLSVSEIKADLFKKAQKSPHMILTASNDKASKIKIQVMDSEKYEVIIFGEGDADTPRAWYWNEPKTGKIIDVGVSENKVEALLDHFMTSDGKGDYTKMANKLRAAIRI